MLTELHPDLYVQRVPYRALGLPLGRQLVVVRLPNGSLWIHSPIPWSAALRAEVDALGPVLHVVGPNRLHDECLREFQTEYPTAEFHAAPGLADQRMDIHFRHSPLGDEAHPDWASVMNQHLVRGMPRVNEVVFLHRPSRTLILADLAFNLGPEGPLWFKLLMRLNGAWGRFAPSKFCKSTMKDRAAVRSSIDHLLTWDFDRIIVGHGRNVEVNGKAVLKDAFRFLAH